MKETKHPFHQFKYCPKCGSSDFNVNNDKSKKCGNCHFTYYFNSCAASVGVIFNKRNELLVATRAQNPAKGTYDLPGGFVDMQETGEQCMIREIKEETNLDVLSVQYIFSIPNIYVYSGFEVHTLDLVYNCKVVDFGDIRAEDDVTRLDFIRRDELDVNAFGLTSIKEIIRRIKDLE